MMNRSRFFTLRSVEWVSNPCGSTGATAKAAKVATRGRARWLGGLAAALVVCGNLIAPPAWADTGVTNIVSGFTTNVVGFTVGTNGPFNALIITNGGQVISSAGGTVGSGSGASNNTALVTGAGALWRSSGELDIGFSGSGNSLIITNGGVVSDNVGGLSVSASSSNNTAFVAGAGSVWSNSSIFFVGGGASGNSLTIANSGQVFNSVGYIGYNASSSNNSVLVTGAGSVWSNSSTLYVGNSGAGNSLLITNGAQVFSAAGEIGYGPLSSNNTVIVTGAGSAWMSTNYLRVGYAGSGNSLTIANGGLVSDITGLIDFASGGKNNSVVVTGAGSVWTNSGSVYVGIDGSGNNLTITNSGAVFDVNGFIGSNSTANNNWALVTGAGSVWSNSGSLYVGYQASSNNLTVANSGVVAATNVVIGANASTGNLVTVSGGNLYATNGAGTGALDVRNGTLTLSSGTVVADNFYASNGASSVVNLNGGTLSVGAAIVSNSTPFIVGDGASAAALMLRSGVSSFANDLVIQNNGTLSIFNTVNVSGNFTQNLGGTLVVNFGGTNLTQYGYLNIAGTASLTGMVAVAAFNGFTPTNGLQLTFLHAAGGWTNGFSGFTNLTALVASLVYPDANDVAVKWGQTSYVPYSQTPNQSSVANALDHEVNNPLLAPLFNFLNGLPTSQLPAALESLSPQGLTTMPFMGLGTANVQGGNIQSRFGALRNGVGGGFNGGLSLFDPSGIMDWVGRQPRLASMLSMDQDLALTKETLTSGIMRHASDNPWGVFVEGAGQFVGVDANQGVSGYHVTSAGLTVGLDRQVLDPATYPHDQLVVGVALGYGNSSTYLANNGRVDINGAQANLYALWYKDGWHVEATGGGGANVYDTKRQVVGQDANGDTQGTDGQGMLGGGYDWHIGEWTFGPRASVQYTRVDIDGFTESGSLAPLTVGSQSMDSLLTQVGMHVAHTSEIGTTLWTPDLWLGWQHESMDSVTAVNAQFANGQGNIFSSQGVPIGRDSAVVGLGLTVQLSKDLATYINYSTELMRNNYSVQNVSAGIRFSF